MWSAVAVTVGDGSRSSPESGRRRGRESHFEQVVSWSLFVVEVVIVVEGHLWEDGDNVNLETDSPVRFNDTKKHK